MRVALSGATGFIGRHVLTALAKEGDCEVTAVGRDVSRITGPCLHKVQLDIGDAPPDVFERLGRPDLLIHVAWGGLPNYHSSAHLNEELPRQYRFLEHLIRSGLPRLFVSGTCLEYGLVNGCIAESVPTAPVVPYGLAKDILRRSLESLREQVPYGLIWARLFYSYGDDQPSNSLFGQLRSAVDRGHTQFNMSVGDQVRDYLAIDEMAQLIAKLSVRKANQGIVNLCSGAPITVRQLAERWVAERDWRIQLNFGELAYPDYEPRAFWGDRRKLNALLEHEN